MRKLLIGMLLASLAVAGCASRGSGGSASPTPSTMSDAQILALGKELAQCIRNHGAPDFPDPVLENGTLTLPTDAPTAGADQALAACQSIVDRIPASAKGEQPPSAEDMQKLIRFAQCLRENGVPEWPAPKADGTFPIVGTPLETEGKSARLMAARDKCRQYWDREIKTS